MNRSATLSRSRREEGFILATVLVFLLVLTVTVFFAAAMTRSDIQVVNNLQNEKEALAIAEAGIHEALYRLSLASGGGSTVTISGISGGAFDASIAPRLPDRGVGSGGSPYGLDSATINSTSQILLNTSGPVAGTNNRVPTLQPVSSRILYSTDTADTGTISLDTSNLSATTANLTVGWDVCSAAAPTLGCSGANAIRQLPLSDPRPVVKVVSTGRSGSATRKIVVWAADVPDSSGDCATSGLCSLGCQCNQGLNLNGSTTLTVDGTVHINAGACDTTPPLCTTASTGGAQSGVTADSTYISGNANGSFDPQANAAALPVNDPFPSMLPPCFGLNAASCLGISPTPAAQNVASNPSMPSGCTGTATNPVHCNVGSITLNPGIYYGGLSMSGNTVMNPGVYIIAGGGFESQTGNTGTVTSPLNNGVGGITIFNTQNDDPSYRTGEGAYGSFVIGTGNANTDLTASTADPYKGILLFQDRNNDQGIVIQGGTTGDYHIDGSIYAPNADALIYGNAGSEIDGSIIVEGPIELRGGVPVQIGSPTTDPGGNPSAGRYRALAWQDF